ncbi:protein of unknown function [Magnetospirillum sp. XM-1]|uniref:hypothetical protein n=1 Tax=Magnetospirillum sp. XM-1 TaxID=1663591 RepID=UPI00073DEEF2|nr:hypothetical protein [Magnetospirillum sp. XM-1]CUW38813.1 protein of unknown function [Magnetospirillum sp. XM-1]
MTDHADLIRRLETPYPAGRWMSNGTTVDPACLDAAAAIKELVAERDGWKDTANQHCRNELYYTDLIDEVAPLLGPTMYTQDDGNVVPEPLRACLPKAVKALVADYKGQGEALIREVNAKLEAQLRAEKAEADLAAARAALLWAYEALPISCAVADVEEHNRHQAAIAAARAEGGE